MKLALSLAVTVLTFQVFSVPKQAVAGPTANDWVRVQGYANLQEGDYVQYKWGGSTFWSANPTGYSNYAFYAHGNAIVITRIHNDDGLSWSMQAAYAGDASKKYVPANNDYEWVLNMPTMSH